MSNQSIEDIFQGKIRVLYAERGVGSFFTIGLSKEILGLSGKEQETIHLWIYLADWFIDQGGKTLVDSDEFSPEALDSALLSAVGRHFRSIRISAQFDEIVLEFSGGFTIFIKEASKVYGDNEDLLKIFVGDVFVLAINYPLGLRREVSL